MIRGDGGSTRRGFRGACRSVQGGGAVWYEARGSWQRGYGEHCIRDETDLAAHLRYCWCNPVKHGLAMRPGDWPYSSVHREIGGPRWGW